MQTSAVIIARGLALLWAGFWLFFFVTESLAWHTPVTVMAFWTGVSLVFVILALVPWRWELSGGILLVIAGLCAGMVYAIKAPPGLSLAVRVITAVVFGVPPIVAGLVLLVHRSRSDHAIHGHALT